MRGVLEFFEGLVAFETLSEMLGALRTDVVAVQTASEERWQVSIRVLWAADTFVSLRSCC